MSIAVFVTGTDTGCGKTRVSCALLAALARSGLTACGMKPVATGATRNQGLLVHDDVRALIAASNAAVPRRYVNPYLFEPACSPHIAAHQTHTRIDLAHIQEAYAACCARSDALVIEGAGGWYVPLADDLWMADLARALAAPILLVIGVRLGSINHGVLSARAIRDSGLPLLGWVANIVDPSTYALDAVLATLERHVPAPRLGLLEWAPDASAQDLAPRLASCVDRLRAWRPA